MRWWLLWRGLIEILLSLLVLCCHQFWKKSYTTDNIIIIQMSIWKNYTDRPPWRHIRRLFCYWMHYHTTKWSAGACLLLLNLPPKIQIFEAINMILYHYNGTIQYCLHITYYQYFYDASLTKTYQALTYQALSKLCNYFECLGSSDTATESLWETTLSKQLLVKVSP